MISGVAAERRDCVLNLGVALEKLSNVAHVRCASAEILRVYWYDGLLRNRLSDEQQALARSDGVKLRLGVVNSYGQQKGVDSRIVMDLVELARNGAIQDALLLSGDEDVRIGVELAQSFGVKVHLLGIEPSRSNQSDALIQEADSTGELHEEDLSEILRISWSGLVGVPIETGAEVSHAETATLLDQVIEVAVTKLNQADLTELAELEPGSYVPPKFDRPLLGNAGTVVGRDLESDERKYLRRAFLEKVRELETTDPST